MEYSKTTLASNKNYRITYYANESIESNKCVITFGEIDSNLDEEGFGSKLVMEEGMDHIYVAQRRRTQYQFLTADNFENIVSSSITGKEVYTYGSSLGGYCAVFYGGAINANILAMSPRIPAHPVINNLMNSRFKNMGFKHKELENSKTSDKRVCIFYDKNNHIDNYYINFFVKIAYPHAEYKHVENAGHYPARALLVSNELKKVARDFFYNNDINFISDNEKILEWHINTAHRRVKKGKLAHAHENIEVLLSSEKADDKVVQNIVATYKKKLTPPKSNNKRSKWPTMQPVISDKEISQVDKAVSLSFVGDLILLRDQLLNAYNPESDEYEFDSMFSYVKKYLKESDFSMGVFEGPTAGETKEYSTSVYGDGIPIRLNFPDSFAYSVRRAGFDFVTTAQNHLLDTGIDGAMRTLDVLDKTGLKHSGSYRNMEEKEKLPIYNIKGLKIAILTYTRSSNGYKSSFFLRDENKHLTSLLVSPTDENFERVKQDVLNDFEKVKKEDPDCIVVLPHMGKQFLHAPDKMQRAWCDIFVDAGADVILNDHAHAVQPYEWRKKPGEDSNVLILHCPGNFVNSYTKNDGDASALTQLYLDSSTGKPFALACIPLWAHSYVGGIYRALPINNIVNDPSLRKHISTHEFSRVKEVHELITKTMLGERLSIDQVQEKYFLFADRSSAKSKGYVRNHVTPLTLTKDMKSREIVRLLSNAKNVCFFGDSVTEGTRNGGYGWFEPLVENFKHLNITRLAKGGAETGYLINKEEEIADINADLYIIAIGTNDVRYHKLGEMTSDKYIANIRQVVEKIQSKNKSAKFVFIAPWTTDNHDPISKLPKNERFEQLNNFGNKLKQFVESSGFLFIDPNPIINKKFKTKNPKTWLIDQIHPNAHEGIELYSLAVVEASTQKKFQLSKPLKAIFNW